MLTLVSSDGSDALAWQVRLLRHSHRRVGQPGPLVVSEDVAPDSGSYPPLNRPYSLSRWAARARTPAETVLILDPDMVFVEPVRVRARPGRVLAQPAEFPMTPELTAALSRHGPTHRRWVRRRAPEALIPPIAITAGDLATLAPVWLDLTRALRADDDAVACMGWLSEMWAFVLACGATGLRVDRQELAAVPPKPHAGGLPIVHYAWATACFDKRRYEPWRRLPACPHPAHRVLDTLIAECGAAPAP